jgi:hypothetical protein
LSVQSVTDWWISASIWRLSFLKDDFPSLSCCLFLRITSRIVGWDSLFYTDELNLFLNYVCMNLISYVYGWDYWCFTFACRPVHIASLLFMFRLRVQVAIFQRWTRLLNTWEMIKHSIHIIHISFLHHYRCSWRGFLILVPVSDRIAEYRPHRYATRQNQQKIMDQFQAELAEMRTNMTQFMNMMQGVVQGQEELRALV